MKNIFLCYTPFTGLGNYGGMRGQKWLKNRIEIFKKFTLSSLLNQTSRNFVHWISWRYEERYNPLVKELEIYLKNIDGYKFIFTYSGICFWDDKYPDNVARERLLNSIHGSIGELIDITGDNDYIMMMIVPSDDCYHREAVNEIQAGFEKNPDLQAIGFSKGYIADYVNKKVAEYDPFTNPPFYTIKFPRGIFIDPLKHVEFTALKRDVSKYKKGTPCPSHEYIGDALKYGVIKERGFLVGTHGENISTIWNHPFKGQLVDDEVLKDFGIYDAFPLKIRTNVFKRIFKLLPHRVQRKLRYWFGELIWNKIKC